MSKESNGMTPNPCPRCGGKMTLNSSSGNMRSFPSVSLCCSNFSGKGDCYWRLAIPYDELGGMESEQVGRKLVEQWNAVTDRLSGVKT